MSFVRPSLTNLGDLVIIDWGYVTEASELNVQKFLVNMLGVEGFGTTLHYRPPQDNDRLNILHGWGSGLNKLQTLLGHLSDSSIAYGRREAAAQQRKLLAESIGIPQTPLEKIFQGLIKSTYPGDLKGFVKDLVGYYSWVLSLGPQPSSQEKANIDQILQQILDTTGPAWSQGGIDMKAAAPWIRHLDQKGSEQETTQTLKPQHPSPKVPEGHVTLAEAATRFGISPAGIYNRIRGWTGVVKFISDGTSGGISVLNLERLKEILEQKR